MEVEVRLEAENLFIDKPEKRLICTSYFTFVIVKEPGSDKKLPKFVPSNSQDQTKFYEAIERRRIRFRSSDLFAIAPKLIESYGVTSNDNECMDENIKTISDSAISSVMVVLPPNANPHGNTFGGQVSCIKSKIFVLFLFYNCKKIMDWMEETARLASKKHARRPMYLHHIDDIRFIKPSKVGDWLTIKAQVNRVFGNSLEVGVRVEACSFADIHSET